MKEQVEISDIKKIIRQMGDKTALMLEASVKALTKNDLDAAQRARQYEKEVDSLYQTVDGYCASYLAAKTLSTGDLYFLIATLKISSELERTADYGNNIAKLAQNNFPHLDISSFKPLFGPLEEMSEKAVHMLKNAVDAYETRNEELALKVLESDKFVNILNKKLFKGILASVTVKPWTQEVALDFHIVVRYLERVADRSTNIAEWVFYINSGQHYASLKELAASTDEEV